MSEVRYETPYTQNFYHKSEYSTYYLSIRIKTFTLLGVDVSPQQHAQERMEAFRAATVEAAKLDPNVGSVQYGAIVGNGVGSDWAVVFTEKDFNIAVQFDESKKNKWTGVRTRKIGYTLSVTLIQENRPMTGNPEHKPRQIMVGLS